MVDTLDSLARSRNMAKIRSKDTKPEIAVRKFLFSKGLRFRVHDSRLIGKPDIVLPKYKTVIFVHGCFWHRHKNCRLAYSPKTRVEFWKQKFQSNIDRDAFVFESLKAEGWRIVVVWECAIRSKRQSEYLSQIYEGVMSEQINLVVEDMPS